jgi:hypothetical protein
MHACIDRKHGIAHLLFLVRRARICKHRRISSCRPITGSILPPACAARWVKLVVKRSKNSPGLACAVIQGGICGIPPPLDGGGEEKKRVVVPMTAREACCRFQTQPDDDGKAGRVVPRPTPEIPVRRPPSRTRRRRVGRVVVIIRRVVIVVNRRIVVLYEAPVAGGSRRTTDANRSLLSRQNSVGMDPFFPLRLEIALLDEKRNHE